ETLEAFQQLKETGEIRDYGVSNSILPTWKKPARCRVAMRSQQTKCSTTCCIEESSGICFRCVARDAFQSWPIHLSVWTPLNRNECSTTRPSNTSLHDTTQHRLRSRWPGYSERPISS